MIKYKNCGAPLLHIVQYSQPPETDYTDYLYGCDHSLKEVNSVTFGARGGGVEKYSVLCSRARKLTR